MRAIRLRFAIWRFFGVALLVPAPSLVSANTPFLDAVNKADVATVRIMLDEGVAVDAPQADGTTALHAAVLNDDLAIVDLLLGAGAGVNLANRYGVTPLALAASNGDPVMIRRLLNAGADVNARSREGQTILMNAALNGNSNAISALLEHGADVHATEAFRGQSALMWAAARGNVDAIEVLIEAGADLHAKSTSGFTALLFAVRDDRAAAVEALLRLGANIEDQARDGTSVLNVAIVNAYFDLASLLLEAGADPNVSDPRGSALHTVAWLHKPGATWDSIRGYSVPEASPRPTGQVTALELARKLLERGANPNTRVEFQEIRFGKALGQALNPPSMMLGRHYLTFNGATPFYVAARNGDYRLMALLAEFGADATVPNIAGVTPLMAAAGLDYYEGETAGPLVGVPEDERLAAVQLAHELGNDINAKTNFGDYTMLGSAEFTLLTYPQNFDELADLGVGDPRFDGMTALHGSIISKQPSIVRYLIDHGADVLATNDLGWTPLMMAQGFFLANEKKEFQAAADMLLDAMPVQAAPR